MSPFEITILLHYYTTPGVDVKTSADPMFCIGTMQKLVHRGLLMHSRGVEREFELTEKGQFYVREGLCQVPLPVSTFVIPPRQPQLAADVR